jgi:hypothetical protein
MPCMHALFFSFRVHVTSQLFWEHSSHLRVCRLNLPSRGAYCGVDDDHVRFLPSAALSNALPADMLFPQDGSYFDMLSRFIDAEYADPAGFYMRGLLQMSLTKAGSRMTWSADGAAPAWTAGKLPY